MDEKILLIIQNILDEHGIDNTNLGIEEKLEMDSIQYISIIVSMEEILDISIGDDFLTGEDITVKSFYDMAIYSMK